MRIIAVLLFAAAAMAAADLSGKWSGTIERRNSDGSSDGGRPAYMVLAQKGEEITGTAGPDAENQNAVNGKITGDKVTLQTDTGRGKMKFDMKLDGDKLAGDVRAENADGSLMATGKISLSRVP